MAWLEQQRAGCRWRLGCLGGIRALAVLALPCVLAAGSGWVVCPALADTPGAVDSAPPPEPTRELIAERLAQVEQSTELEAALKSRLSDLLKQALEELRLADERASRTAEIAAARNAAPAALERLQCELTEPEDSAVFEFPTDATLAELDQVLAAVAADVAQAQRAFAELENEPKRRSMRRVELAKLISATTQRLEELERPPAPKPDEPPEVLAARRWLQAARKKATQAELAMYQQEAASFDGPAGELLKLNRDMASRMLALHEKRAAILRQVVFERRRSETERQAAEARRAAALAEPALRRLAEQNQALAEHRERLASNIESVAAEAQVIAAQLARVSDEFKRVTEKVKAAGLTDAVGHVLRKQRADLPNIRQLRQEMRQRQDEVTRVQLELFDLEDRRAALADVDAQVEATWIQIGALPAVSRTDLRTLLQTERDYLDALIADYDVYFKKLVDLQVAERELIAETETYARFIDQNVLWIRSASRLSAGEFVEAGKAAWGLLDPGQWGEAALTLARDPAEHPWAWLLAAGIVPLWALRRRLRGRLRQLGAQAASPRALGYAPTWQAVALTALVGLPKPAALGFVGWRLSAGGDELAMALGSALQAAAWVWLPIEAFRQVCRPGGLAEAHFLWPPTALEVIRRHLRWAMWAGLPLVLVVAVVEHQSQQSWKDSLGRLAFIGGQGVLAAFMWRVLRPGDGALHQANFVRRGGWFDRLGYVWYVAFVAAPVALAVLAAAGFYFTALRLAWRFQFTLLLVLGLVIVHAMLVRWVVLANRRLVMQALRQQRLAESQDDRPGDSDVPVMPEQPGVDLMAINHQTRRLLHCLMAVGLFVGLGAIWADMLPALGVLNEVVLWGDAEGGGAITLASLATALLIVLLTVVASRNLPGLVEMVLLQRLPLEPAARYAVTAVSRYVICVVGIVAACAALGIGWSKVQWLVAAVTFGLGFGLQEIFANFVSGLIILFERPMRVGDTVTIGDVTGIVTRIRMRATTITDWDRKELIVPNKEFITGRLVNWTLSDTIIRAIVRVGIAYGSDTELAQRLLLKVAQEHPNVLDEPPPRALFVGFGDSSLNFELRVFVPAIDVYMTTIHELNSAIDRGFRKAGIEIAYPQRDLHIRSFDAAIPLAGAKPHVAVHVPAADQAAGA